MDELDGIEIQFQLELIANTHLLVVSLNSFQAISVIRGARYSVFTNKKHALNTFKMAPLLRSDVMFS
jgi:hypothetical protein